jgi:hypothetical protein
MNEAFPFALSSIICATLMYGCSTHPEYSKNASTPVESSEADAQYELLIQFQSAGASNSDPFLTMTAVVHAGSPFSLKVQDKQGNRFLASGVLMRGKDGTFGVRKFELAGSWVGGSSFSGTIGNPWPVHFGQEFGGGGFSGPSYSVKLSKLK